MTEWFQEWFGEEYLRLYPHRDRADAEALVALIRKNVPWKAGMRVLDVGCGAGRHAEALRDAGARVVGLDLSRHLLACARKAGIDRLVRCDMRALPLKEGVSDLTVNLFTSFGYFSSDDEHQGALRGMVATLKRGGWFAIDFLHAPWVIANLVPESETTLGGQAVRITKRLLERDRFVEKTIHLVDGRRFVERVRLLTPKDLEMMLQQAGLAVRCRFGDYAGGPLVPGAARTILLGERAA